MATKRFRGDLPDLAEVHTITVAGTWLNAETATLTINGKPITITLSGAQTIQTVASALKAAWAGEAAVAGETRNNTGNDIPEFAQITPSVVGAVLTLTKQDQGEPVTITESETSAGGTLTQATTVAGDGPNWWSLAGNWSASGVPANGDDVYAENTDVPIRFGLAQSAVTLASLHFMASFLGDVGLPDRTDGGWFEYLPTYLAIGATVWHVGEGPGAGSPRIRLDNGAVQMTGHVWQTGRSPDEGTPALLWKGTHISNVLNVNRGDVGIAWLPGEAATLATLNVSFIENRETDSTVRCGAGLTLTTLLQDGGECTLYAGCTTITLAGGKLTMYAGNVTTVTQREGTFNYNGNGTLTTIHVQGGAILDLTGSSGNMVITTFNVYAGAVVRSPKGRFASAPTVRLNGCTVDEVTLAIEDDFNVVHV